MLNLNSVGTSILNSAGAILLGLGARGAGVAGFAVSSVVRDGPRCGAPDGHTSPVGNSTAFGEISAAITDVEMITVAM
jgi:hypothetical protein